MDNSVPYNEWKNNIEKIAATQKNEINLSVAEKIMQDRYPLNHKLCDSLLKKPEINLNAAIKLIGLEQKNTLIKHYTHNHTQNAPSIQKNINVTKDLNSPDISKSLSKTEKEIY
ncbi:hypothetical protein GAMM_250011 [Gammaproteobacteria bacterium]